MNESKSKCTSLKQLFDKEVINISSGDRLGYIDDADVDMECGELISFYIGSLCKNPFSKNHNVYKFSFGDIVKIGQDTILIKNCTITAKNKEEKSKKCCK